MTEIKRKPLDPAGWFYKKSVPMGFFELFLIAVGLSMDASAAALCKGLVVKQRDYQEAFRIAFSFAFFQGIMPLIGWFVVSRLGQSFVAYSRWIAFGLLLLLGLKMVFESLKKGECTVSDSARCSNGELILLSIATSIDALIVGAAFACLRIKIVPALLLIALITYLLSFFSYLTGNRIAKKTGIWANVLGGVVLILIGVRVITGS